MTKARDENKIGRRLAEWVSLAISALIILGLSFYFVAEVARGAPREPQIDVRVRTAEARLVGTMHLLPVEVTNRGATASELAIRVEVAEGDRVIHSEEAVLKYLGGGSSQKILYYLERDPKGLRVTARATRYQLQ